MEGAPGRCEGPPYLMMTHSYTAGQAGHLHAAASCDYQYEDAHRSSASGGGPTVRHPSWKTGLGVLRSDSIFEPHGIGKTGSARVWSGLYLAPEEAL